MTPEQEKHLQSIKDEFISDVDTKYRAGQKAHGGDLIDKDLLSLVDMAIEEAIDQFVYLTTLRNKILILMKLTLSHF